jgi:hypothetical protein
MTRDELFPSTSKFFRASDLSAGPVVVEIEVVRMEELRNNGKAETKPVAYFRRQRKALVINRTNFDAIGDATNIFDTDKWPGRTIELFPATTEMNGQIVPCVRARKPQPGAPALTTTGKPLKPARKISTDDMDDEIPF